MTRRLCYIIFVGIFLLSVSPLFAQKDSAFIRIHHKNIEEAKKLKMQLTRDERKLEGSILGMLRIHEEADTSVEKRKLRDKLVRRDDILHIDSQERITVLIDYKSISDSGSLKSLIQSLGGEVKQYGPIPTMKCRIPIRKLRQIIALPAVKRVREQIPGETNISSIGDVQLKADQARTNYGINGAGVTIGVISKGFDGWEQVQSQGELLLATNIIC